MEKPIMQTIPVGTFTVALLDHISNIGLGTLEGLSIFDLKEILSNALHTDHPDLNQEEVRDLLLRFLAG